MAMCTFLAVFLLAGALASHDEIGVLLNILHDDLAEKHSQQRQQDPRYQLQRPAYGAVPQQNPQHPQNPQHQQRPQQYQQPSPFQVSQMQPVRQPTRLQHQQPRPPQTPQQPIPMQPIEQSQKQPPTVQFPVDVSSTPVDVAVNVYYLGPGSGGASVKQRFMGNFGGYHWALQVGTEEYSFGMWAGGCKDPSFTSKICDGHRLPPDFPPRGSWPRQLPWPGHEPSNKEGYTHSAPAIYRSEPQNDPSHLFKISLPVDGTTSGAAVYSVLKEMVVSKAFSGEHYDMLNHNCQVFTETFIENLGLDIPDELDPYRVKAIAQMSIVQSMADASM